VLRQIDDVTRKPILEKILKLLDRFDESNAYTLCEWVGGGDIPFGSSYIFDEFSKRSRKRQKRSEISVKTQSALEDFRDSSKA
jgi:hypothetical protein